MCISYDFRQRKKASLSRRNFYKTVTLNVDHAGRSDRTEWGHLRYQHYYDPSEAFEIAIQWSVASGNFFVAILQCRQLLF